MVLPNTPIHAQWKLAEHLRERRLAAGLTQEGPAHMMKHQVKEIRVGLQFDQETMPDTPIQLPICKPWLRWVERLPIPKKRKGQAMNRITAYLKTKQGPHLITSSRKNAQEEYYRYAEKSVPIPEVLARKANGKEITYVYTERTAEGKVMQMAMVRIPDTPEIR